MSGAFRTTSLLSVTVLRMTDMALQFLTPLLLVRLLSQNDFGDYRIFWLIVNTVMFIAPLGMPRSLFHFLPKIGLLARTGFAYVINAAIVSVATTVLLILPVWAFAEYLPGAAGPFMAQHGFVVVCFTVVWSFASLWENLPNSIEDHSRQAVFSVILTVLRVGAVVGLAANSGDLALIFWGVFTVGIIQVALVAIYIDRKFGWDTARNSWDLFSAQFSYAAPYGLAASASSLRRNVDQWIVVGRFSSVQFAALSLASTLLMPFEVLRTTANNMLLPRLSRANARGVKRSLVLYRRVAPAYVALFSFAAGACLVTGAELSAVIFGSGYALSGIVLSFYLFQMAVQTLGCSPVFSLMGKGNIALAIAALQIGLSIIGTLIGILNFGLIGAVGGPLLSTIIGDSIMLILLAHFAGVKVSSMHRWKSIGFLLVGFALSASFANFIIDWLGGVDYVYLPAKILIFLVLGGALLALSVRYGQRKKLKFNEFFIYI